MPGGFAGGASHGGPYNNSMPHHPQVPQHMQGQRYAAPPQQGMPPQVPYGTYNGGHRMAHVANNTLGPSSFGAMLPSKLPDENRLNSGVVTQIQMDWDNRQYLEAITLGIKKIADFLNRFDLSCQTRLASLNERLTSLERQLEYIQAKLPATNSSIA